MERFRQLVDEVVSLTQVHARPSHAPIRVYHGTSTALLKSIAKRGLIAGTVAHSEGPYCSTLSVTTDPEGTEQWKEEACWTHGGDPVVLTAIVRRDEIEVNQEYLNHCYDPEMCDYGFIKSGRIPPNELFVLTNGRLEPLLQYVKKLD